MLVGIHLGLFIPDGLDAHGQPGSRSTSDRDLRLMFARMTPLMPTGHSPISGLVIGQADVWPDDLYRMIKDFAEGKLGRTLNQSEIIDTSAYECDIQVTANGNIDITPRQGQGAAIHKTFPVS
jgi:hypothetical protein